VLRILQTDINRVTDAQPPLALDAIPAAQEIVLVGTIGKNPIIDRLIQNKKIDPEGIAGHRETFLIQVVDHPFPEVKRALIIAGSEKRGTIYGMFDLSAQIGVSPWYWWADVPVKKKSNIYVLSGRYTQGEPAVRYRGIFINDEAPALSGWVYENFEGFNHKFYEKVFELVLRLKGNFLWPAMWGRAFYDDDPQNPQLADEYGVVIGTSHHEPMMRAHDEWRRYGSGPWNYEKNEEKLQEFWREGIRRMNDYESVVTLGMRGDGDMPMSDKANIALLERIVKDQREILAQESGKDIKKIPQVWALYKEVQDYYDKGMRVPDDVTLLFSDDNWGNIRRLPQLHAKPRSGGYGIYYHYDYVGGPRNYKWLNTTQISRVWEQMHLAYEYGVRRIWIVNVGDIKPMEFPISFFLDYAWNPEKWPAERLPDYYRLWAEQQFGPEHAQENADIIAKYTKYNSRRKPELLSPSTYSLVHDREAERIVEDYNILVKKAEKIYNDLPENYRAAYYQLVLHPVSACANLNELYVTVGKNRLYAEQGRAATNQMAEKARALFEKDAEITHYYNKIMAGGKWNHMMDQTHIGYTYWQQPDKNSLPKVKTIKLANTAKMGVAVQGSKKWWPKSKKELVLPEFDPYNKQKYYIDLFNQGKTPFLFSVKAEKSCLKIEPPHGQVDLEKRIWVSIDW
ncbi:MAG: glycosyl hydrolase 115 family protein, partial [bacterium]